MSTWRTTPCARESATSPRSRRTRSGTWSRGAADGPLLAVFAHLDVIGLAVAHVPDDALIPVHTLGGWRAAIAYGQRVDIQTANGIVPGVVARRTRDDEKVEWDQLYVDVGARDGEQARSLVAPGDPLVVAAPPVELAGGRIASRSLDNRAGVYLALEALRRLATDGAARPGRSSPRRRNRLHCRDGLSHLYGRRPDVLLPRGNPSGVVSIPLRYMHSPIEVADLGDLEGCVNLLVAYARRLRPGTSYAR